ncbi:MAG: IS200/IS605 family transposase [Acidobacteria bacterium]|nr:IS200/IS605 family transposase [Acidobacteriota bacterium]
MDIQQLNTSSHSAYKLFYHIVFTVKYRHKCITSHMLSRLKTIFDDVLRKWRCRLIEFGGEADHVHLLVEAHPSMDLSRMIGNLKTVSARRIRQEFSEYLRPYFWKPYFWNNAYAVVSVGGRPPLEKLIDYIQDQDSPPPQPNFDT